MSTTTLVKMKYGLSTLSLLQPYETRKRKTKKKMASRRLDPSQLNNDLHAGASARVKRFHSKSRRGCLTCRQRRVKCDEQRGPNCDRCEKGGYVCEWQDPSLGRSRASDDRLSRATTRSPSLATTRSDDDAVSHRFFAEGIVVQIASLFTDMAESFTRDPTKAQHVSVGVSNFYYQAVRQASRSSQIIRKTLTTICGLYERANASSRSSSPRSPEYITQYSEAVTDLRRSSRELTPDIVLIASILFANCEYLMGDLCSAVSHLRAGAKILIEHRNLDGGLPPELTETLSTIFEVFDHDVIELESTAIPGLDYLATVGEHQFTDLRQANEQLLQIYSHTFALRRVGQNHPRHVSPAAHDFRRWSDGWRARTTNLEHSLDTGQRPWLQLLQGQHSALNTIIDAMSCSSTASTSHQELDNLILQVSTFLQVYFDSYQDQILQNRPYLENVGLILPLYLVTMLCEDASTCEAALSLLRRLRLVEGDLNSCCAYAIARAAIDARYTTRVQSNLPAFPVDDTLPTAEVKRVMLSESGTELDVTFELSYNNMVFGQSESNAIVGGFCFHETGSMETLCNILEAGGFQGPVQTQSLEGCSCHEGF